MTKAAVRSREVLRFLPCRLRSRRGRPNSREAKYWGQHVCPAKVRSLTFSAVQLTIVRLTTTTTVRKLVRLYQEKPNVCVCVCVCVCVAHGTRRGSEDEKGWTRVVVCLFWVGVNRNRSATKGMY